jgi:hypothetical protein
MLEKVNDGEQNMIYQLQKQSRTEYLEGKAV